MSTEPRPVTRIHIREAIIPDLRLGRHVHHDPRSLDYLEPHADPATLVSVRHVRHIPVLNQGDLGSCTGNASEGALGTSPLFEAIPDTHPDKPSTNDAQRAEASAVKIYSAATLLDGFDGEWPPTDTGSDGLSAAKACVAAGLISGYTHATSLEASLAALARQPVIAGINWYSSFDEPDRNGRIRITSNATIRGGHEIVLDQLDVEKKLVWFTNSWGTGWGVQGRACFSWDDFTRLLHEEGDVTVFTPLVQPSPTPTPPANPMTELAALLRQAWVNIDGWLTKHNL